MRVLHAETINLARSASDRFRSTTSGGSIPASRVLEKLRVTSIHGLQIHECLCTSAIQLRALVVMFASSHTDVQRSPKHPRPQQLRDMSKSNPSCQARTTRRGPLSWVDCRSPQCERRSDSAPASTNRERARLRAGTSGPATSRNCSSDTHPAIRLNTRSFDLFATRSRSNRSSKHSTRMSSLDGFASALIGAPLGKLPLVPTTSASWNQCASHCHQVARVQQLEVICDGADFRFIHFSHALMVSI